MAETSAQPEADDRARRGRRFHWVEKLQVQIASAAALAAVYFWLYKAFRPWDGDAAIAFLPYGAWAQLGLLAVTVWGLAAVAALLTTHARPEGALIATLIGVCGLSLRSPQMRTLVWQYPEGTRGMFLQLVGETALLVVVLVVALVVIAMFRSLVASINPSWVRRDVWATMTAEDMGEVRAEGRARVFRRFLKLFFGAIVTVVEKLEEKSGRPVGEGERVGAKDRPFADAASCMGLSLVASVVLVLVLLQSADRGQIIFALLAANLLGMLIAHQVFPARSLVVAWLAPMLMGMAFYVLAAVGALHDGANAWAHVSPIAALALPIDWMTAGAGGGVVGFWISQRIHELKHLEKQEKESK